MIQNFWLCWMLTSPGGPVGSYINALLKKRLWFKAGFNWGKGGGGYQIVPLTRWCKILELYSVFTWRHGGNNNETAAMLVFQTNPVGIKLLSYVKAFFFPRHFHRRWLREWKRSIRSVLIHEQDPWLGIEMREKQSQKSSPRPFSKIMLNKLRLLPEISINYMSDIWVTIISYFLTTLTMNTQTTETN